jgi:hypothetical protein
MGRGSNERQVLVKNVLDEFARARLSDGGGELFEKSTWKGFDKTEVEGLVETFFEIFCDATNVLESRGDEIDGGDVWDGWSAGMKLTRVRVTTVGNARARTYTWRVTPTSLRSWTRRTVARTSFVCWSRTRIFQTGGPVSGGPVMAEDLAAGCCGSGGGWTGLLRLRRARRASV